MVFPSSEKAQFFDQALYVLFIIFTIHFPFYYKHGQLELVYHFFKKSVRVFNKKEEEEWFRSIIGSKYHRSDNATGHCCQNLTIRI